MQCKECNGTGQVQVFDSKHIVSCDTCDGLGNAGPRTVDFTGTVSESTMRVQDLVPEFMEVLREYHPDKFNVILYDIAFGNDERFTLLQAGFLYIDMIKDDNHHGWQSEAMSYILNEDIWSAMNEIAPSGYYFGSHPGDGCNYGFWRVDPSETGCYHEWLRIDHSVAGRVWQCPLCKCIAEHEGDGIPCRQCGDKAVKDVLCHFCRYWGQRVA